MKRRWLAAACVLVLATAGLTTLGLWLGGAAWSGSGQEAKAFCESLSGWHEVRVRFSQRINRQGSRVGDGLSATYELFKVSAKLPLPQAGSEQELALRDTLREVVRVEEGWLSDLRIFDSLVSTEPSSSAAREALVPEVLAAYQRGEVKRVQLNDLLREGNALLDQVCGLPPLPINSD